MTNNNPANNSADHTINFADAQAIMTAENIKAHASEVHGILTGLVCAGFAFEEQGYLAMVNDLLDLSTAESDSFPKAVQALVKQMYSELWTHIVDDSYTFQLLLPDDDDSIVERGHALGVWVQGFNLGFGVQQKDTPVTSNEVKEVITDFAEIANLSDDMEEDEDTEQAFFEISEYVRISALLCFSELGTMPAEAAQSPKASSTIH